MPRKIEISHRTIIFTVLFLGFLWFLAQILSIIVALFISLLLMTALNPIVDKLNRFHVPRGIAILLVYIVLIAVISLGLSAIVPPLIEQTGSLRDRLPAFLGEMALWFQSIGFTEVNEIELAKQISQIGSIPANLLSVAVTLFSNIIAVIGVLVITFYLLLERKNLNRYLLVLFGEGGEKKAKGFVDALETRLGGWVRGELLLMLIIGIVTYIGLVLLGIPFALPLAILAGILEIVPVIGPIISAIPSVLIAFAMMGPVMGLATAALYFLIQQLENGIVVPKVMQAATGVSPIVTIIALTAGFKLGGVAGAVLAVPIVVVVQVTATEAFSSKRFQRFEAR